jgi:XRE family transcriptional regulator, regulator of sulfur utilization
MPDAPQSQRALAAAIRQIREREGLTQEELAVRAGVHLTWISRVESGRHDLMASSLRGIADGLGVTMVELSALAERLELD